MTLTKKRFPSGILLPDSLFPESPSSPGRKTSYYEHNKPGSIEKDQLHRS